ncbi:MAG: 2-dehydropantoate 2-reductase [Victivallaceae bacterium]|nr:2-dehydropantoate 2-reductase [Victivallaceae bacterium]
MSLNVLLIGAGAIGVYFSGRLAGAGAAVTVAARSDYDAVKNNGYHVTSIAGDFDWRPEIVRDAAEYGRSADLIVIALKALPEVDMVELVRPAVGKNTAFLLIQNGLDVEVPLHEAFPDNELYSAIAFIGVSRLAPGVVDHKGGGELTVGLYGSSAVPDKLRGIAELFSAAKVKCSLTDDTERMRWGKLLWNVPFNPLSVLAGGMTTSEMMADKHVELLAFKLMKEVQLTAHACGVDLPEAQLEHNMEYTRNFSPYKTSMLLDFENRRPLEVEAILGSVVRRAKMHNVDTPCIDCCYVLLGARDRMNRKK